MTDNEIVEQLARAACIAVGTDPDTVTGGPYGLPTPSYAPDGVPRTWHKFIDNARRFLAMQRCSAKIRNNPSISAAQLDQLDRLATQPTPCDTEPESERPG
jgi:hypothetical protein